MSLLSEIPYAAVAAYSPHIVDSDERRRHKRVQVMIKDADKKLLEWAHQCMTEHTSPGFYDRFLGPDVVLVPAPRSAPLHSADAMWPAWRICDYLVSQGFGRLVLPCLVRTEAVPKSAFAAPGERPDAQRHFETIRADFDLTPPTRITVVDDILTKGNTLLACVSLIKAAVPHAEVQGFALARARWERDFTEFFDPIVSTIVLRGTDCRRID